MAVVLTRRAVRSHSFCKNRVELPEHQDCRDATWLYHGLGDLRGLSMSAEQAEAFIGSMHGSSRKAGGWRTRCSSVDLVPVLHVEHVARTTTFDLLAIIGHVGFFLAVFEPLYSRCKQI
jgi:hypothetical protein